MKWILPATSRSYTCRCGRPIFFRNSQCLACNAPLGYEPALGDLCALEPAEQEGVWRLANGRRGMYRRCVNLDSASGCNWLVSLEGSGKSPQPFCRSCRLDRTIPDLSVPANGESYRQISIAQRRLVALLISLDLPVASRVSEDPEHGMAFDFLHNLEGGPHVITGHSDGIITLNIEEAEDPTRERIRDEMGEPYRTLLGHFRHEVGHYYWDRLIDGSPWIEEFRKVFGDERADYAAALEAHYQRGPAPDWRMRFVTAYAGSHPWEDWAETWAHYLHIVDTFDTARSFGLDPEASIEIAVEPFTADALTRPNDPGAGHFLDFINSWMRLTAVLNELSRSMGLADFYPFVLSRSMVAKLHFIHLVIGATAADAAKAA